MEKVAVLLSAYNGEKYIREQIDSILAQQQVEVLLFIRDDGSRDATPQIIEELCRTHSNIIFTDRDERVNLGVRESFMTLLGDVIKLYPGIRYFSFADQDDVWLENKLIKALRCFSPSDHNILYFSNKTIVDSSLKFIAEESIDYVHDISEICWGAQASGCTMLFDADLARIVLPHYKEFDLLHDSLIYRLAHLVGTKIVFDKRSFILYRQHRSNVVGIAGSKKTSYNWKGLLARPQCYVSNLYSRMLATYRDAITPEGRRYLALVADYKHSASAGARLIWHELRTKRPLRLHLIWIGKIVLHRL